MYKVVIFVILFLFSTASLTADRYIKIITPVEQDIVDPTRPLLVNGTGRGLFEGNVVVRVEDSAGAQLVQVLTTMKRSDIAAEGEWQISIELPKQVTETIRLFAFSPSPKDGEPAITSRSIILTTTYSGLEESSWLLGYYRDASGKLAATLPGTTVTAHLKNGKLSGSAGCNSFSASYVISDNQMTIGPAMATRMYCAEPEGIMAQEQEYLQALSRVRVYTLMDSRLQLRDVKGALQVDFVVSEEIAQKPGRI